MKTTMSKAGLVLAAVLVFLSSCSKPPKSLEDLSVSANPSPLEVHNGTVETTIDASFPEKFVPAKAIVEITPVIKYDGGEVASKAFKIQGEKVEANNPVIAKTGGSVTNKASFEYNDDMKVSELVLRAKVIIGKKEKVLPDYKIADGVITTAMLVDTKGGKVALGKDEFQRIINENTSADIKYLIQQSTVRSSETRKDDVKALNAKLKEAYDADSIEINSLQISAYASPDGPQDLNDRVSDNRQSSSNSYMSRQMRRSKVDVEAEKIILESMSEDWEGFKEKLEASDVQDKDLILRVLSMYSDPAKREEEIKNLSSAFEELKEKILPELRRAKLNLNVSVIGRTDEEIATLAAEDPYKLTVEELLYAATLTEDAETKLEIYKNATKFYPEEWRGFNNVGYILYNMGEYQEAETAFAKANQVKSEQPVVVNNMGVMALVGNNFDVAEEYFGRAAGAGSELDYNLGIISLNKSEYSVADDKLTSYNTNNAALVKIMTKDYTSALEILKAVEKPDGLTAYLTAVTGARTNDKDLVVSSMKKAVEADAKFKAMAKEDIEFMAYFADEDFKAVVE